MNDYLSLVAALLVLTLLISLIRIFIGPEPADRLLVAQLFGTVGVAIVLLLATIQMHEALLNAALVLALLAPLTLITFIRLTSGDREKHAHGDEKKPLRGEKPYGSQR